MRNADVLVLHSLALGLERGLQQELIADQETAIVADRVARALQDQVASVRLVPVFDGLADVLSDYDPEKHVVFNLCESLGGRAFTEPEAVHLLRDKGFIHTGAPYEAMRLCANKRLTKRALEKAGLPTPHYQVIRQRKWSETLSVPLPAIVKPVAEGGSFGVRQDSLATSIGEVRDKVEECLRIYRQPVLVEEYIAGREINVALWGNRQVKVLPISEVLFTWTDDPLRQFVTFEAKWISESVEYHGSPAVCPAHLSADEQQAVESAAQRAYRTLGLRGYARVDMRLRDGKAFILEVNANPDLAPDAGFFRSARAAGHSYESMILRILKLALAAQA